MPYTIAAEQDVLCFSMPADADLDTTSYQFYIACIDSTDYTIKVASDADSTTEPPIGVIYDKPTAKWQPCLVAYSGIARVMAGGVIAAGDAVTCNASGLAIATTTAGDKCIGRAVSVGASGAIVFVLMGMFMYEAT